MACAGIFCACLQIAPTMVTIIGINERKKWDTREVGLFQDKHVVELMYEIYVLRAARRGP